MMARPEVLGLQVLFEGPNPSVDIIAVHGLGASPDWAWIRKVRDGKAEVHVNWLADENMLPAKLPDSRIMTFNYESKWFMENVKQRRSLCAIQLLTALDNKRKEEKDTENRPLLFIGHSFGGVVIEQTLVSANSHGGSFQYLASCTVGVIFLGTPHRGTQAGKWGEYVARIAKALGFRSDDTILRDLQEDSEGLRDLLYEFTLWTNRSQLKLICFFEQHETDYVERSGVTWKEFVVGETSACIDGYRKVRLPTDHLKINKYSGPDDPSYNTVYPLIVGIVQKAVRIVYERLNPQTTIKDNSRIPEKNLKCLYSLFISNPRDDLAAIRNGKGDRVDGTCEWILTQDRYSSWLVEDSPQLLWLSGAPGIGKTMISSFLVGELMHLAERSSQMTLAYYFCDDKYEGRRTATAILRGLLLQLLRQQPILFKYIQPDFDQSGDRLFSNFHALWRIFVCIVKDPEAGQVCCLIDALDECEKESRQLFLADFTKLFCSQQSKETFVKFIVTSRREIDIEESLSVVSPAIRNLQVDSGKVNDDLSKFIDAKVDALSTQKKYGANLKETIKRALTDKAGGTFLYVSLVLEDLKKAKISLQVQQKLQELPSDLNKVYNRILSQIDADCVEIAQLVLRWVAVARRPLTTKELAMALAMSMEKWEENEIPSEDLLDGFKCCEPLVYVETRDDTINLVHQSAKDYLMGTYLQTVDDLSHYHVVPDRTNLLIFKTCWTYLSQGSFEKGTMIVHRDESARLDHQDIPEELLDSYRFLDYTSQEWLEHALAANPALATDYGFRKDILDNLPTLRDYWLLGAAAEGQELVVQRLLDNGAELESKDWFNRTPLSLAVKNGHEAIVKLLLSRDNVDINTSDDNHDTPLSSAAKNRHEKVIRLLLDRDDTNINSSDEDGRTPLSWAAGSGSEAVVRLLLDQDNVDINSQRKYGQTPLSIAAENGYKKVVGLLLDQDNVDINCPDIEGDTPLWMAVNNGHEEVVKLLLDRNDIDINSSEYRSPPLSRAVTKGHEAIVRLLLNRDDIDISSLDPYGDTALSLAAEKGHKGVVMLLLDRIDATAHFQIKQALRYATRKRHKAIVKLLEQKLRRVSEMTDDEDDTL